MRRGNATEKEGKKYWKTGEKVLKYEGKGAVFVIAADRPHE